MSLTDRQLATLKELHGRDEVRADILNAKALLKFHSLGWCEQTSKEPKTYRLTDAGRSALAAALAPTPEPTPEAPVEDRQISLF